MKLLTLTITCLFDILQQTFRNSASLVLVKTSEWDLLSKGRDKACMLKTRADSLTGEEDFLETLSILTEVAHLTT